MSNSLSLSPCRSQYRLRTDACASSPPSLVKSLGFLRLVSFLQLLWYVSLPSFVMRKVLRSWRQYIMRRFRRIMLLQPKLAIDNERNAHTGESRISRDDPLRPGV